MLLLGRPTTFLWMGKDMDGCWPGDPPEADRLRQRRTSYARGVQVTPEADKFRQRRTGYVPTQSGRTRFRPRRSHRLVLSANIGMILRTQTPAHIDSFGQQRQKFYLVVGQPPNNGIEYHKTGCNW